MVLEAIGAAGPQPGMDATRPSFSKSSDSATFTDFHNSTLVLSRPASETATVYSPRSAEPNRDQVVLRWGYCHGVLEAWYRAARCVQWHYQGPETRLLAYHDAVAPDIHILSFLCCEGSSVDRATESESTIDAGAANRNANLGIQAQRARLPIFKQRERLLYMVETFPVTIVVGQTGCGKTTRTSFPSALSAFFFLYLSTLHRTAHTRNHFYDGR